MATEPIHLMRAPLLWHAREEIEHKSLTFDVFERVDSRYRRRVTGFLIGSALLFVFWGAGIRHILQPARAGPVPWLQSPGRYS